MPNQVTRRIYDFLKDILPFSLVGDEEALMRVAARVEVQYQPVGSVIFRPGEPPRDRFFVVKEGSVELFKVDTDGEEQLIDRCGETDVFGIRPLLAEDNYLFLARAAEETLLYAVNSEGFKEILVAYPRLTQYLATIMAGSNRYAVEYRAAKRQESSSAEAPPKVPAYQTPALMELRRLRRGRTPVVCSITDTIVTAAKRMSENSVGSVVVIDAERHPIGIITDRDLRNCVATGEVELHKPVSALMAKPVVCIGPDGTVADIQIKMMRRGFRHLVQTEDGTDQSPVVGVVSEHDLLVLQGTSPAILIREISRVKNTNKLRELRERAEHLLQDYLDREVSIAFTTAVMTEINDEIIRKCIKLGLARMHYEGLGNPPAPFDWLCLGSQGRGEQLLRTDQDNALIFADVPEARYPEVKNYFLKLASHVTEHLHDVGFDYCDGDMMASNPKWCLSAGKWREQFAHWMRDTSAENLLNTSIFFDYRGVWGDGSLPDQLTEHIFSMLDEGPATRFLASLADAAVHNPSPLTFFRNFVVERSGKHKEAFDLKTRAMRPLTDAARVLVLQARRGNVNNTFRRFEAMMEVEPQNAELYREAADAYEVLIRLRAQLGLRRRDSGRFVKPSELTRVQRLLLRNSFNPVKEIQSLLELRFQLNFLR